MRNKVKRIIQILAVMALFIAVSGNAESVKAADEIWVEWGEEYNESGHYYFYLDQSSKIVISQLNSSYTSYTLYKVDMYTGEKVCMGTTGYIHSGNECYITLGVGYYYIYVGHTNMGVKFTCQPCDSDTDEIESNDTFDTAQEIKLNILYEGNYNNTKWDGYDQDYYKIVLKEDGLVWFETFGSVEATLYAEDEFLNTYNLGEIKSSGAYVNSNRIRLSKGIYYLNIHNYHFNSFNLGDSYKFKVNYEKIDLTASEIESNGTSDEATPIKTNQTYVGNSETPTDVDYYKFTIDQTHKVQLRFDQPRGTAEENYLIELFWIDENDKENRLDKYTTTSNPVNFGKEIILEAGTYYVKVTGQKADSFVDYKLKVNAEKYILVKEIKLTTSTKTFTTGTTFTLKATITPSNAIDKTIVWSSSDETVATVDKNGKVKCLKAGECYIYATNKKSGAVGKYLLVVGKNTTRTLKSVTISAGTLSPEFSSSKQSYKIQLDKDTSKVTISWKKTNSYSTVYVNDKVATKTTVSLKAGQKKTVKVVVVSESGAEKVYKFVVERAYK